jgi:hypothetical protein
LDRLFNEECEREGEGEGEMRKWRKCKPREKIFLTQRERERD